MTREGAETKGARLLTEGRLVVTSAAPGHFAATFGRGGWSCTCPARGLCSHLYAARLIAAPDAARLLAPRRNP